MFWMKGWIKFGENYSTYLLFGAFFIVSVICVCLSLILYKSYEYGVTTQDKL